MSSARILIAGIGNIFFGDDAFGVEVARRLAQRPLPPDVYVHDFGIRGLDLVYALLDPYEAVILVDAVPRGGQAGTLYVLEPDLGAAAAPTAVEPHALDPVKVLRMARELGSTIPLIQLVGCEPGHIGTEDDMHMGMSEPVQAAVEEAVGLVEAMALRLLEGEPAHRQIVAGLPLESSF